jgi:hypothetical protein
MTQINNKMDQAIMNDNFDQIEKIALNPNYAYVKCSQFNIFTGKLTFINKWVDISEVGKEYYDDLNSDCHEYLNQCDKYKHLDYETMVDTYNNEVEQYELKNGTHISQWIAKFDKQKTA